MTLKDITNKKVEDFSKQEEAIIATANKVEPGKVEPVIGQTNGGAPMPEDLKILKLVTEEVEAQKPIPKPGKFNLNKFRSKEASAVGGVDTLQTALSHMSLAAAKDFVRLHPNEDEYWSPELCFVNVPIKGQKRDTLHLIDEDVAKQNGVNPAKLRYCRLALASKPDDVILPGRGPDAKPGQLLGRLESRRV